MERRKFLIGAAGTATGAAALGIGSGAFSMAWANRDITVDTTGDAAAYLGFEVQKSEYAGYDGNQFYLDLDQLNEDANFRFHNVFWLRNNGTNNIQVQAHELDQDGNLGGWNQDTLALHWSEDNLDEDGSIFGKTEGLMHSDEPFDGTDITNPGTTEYPEISPGEAIAVHPFIFALNGPKGGDNGVGAVPNQIAFYAEVR